MRGLTGTVNTAGSTVQRVSGDGSVITYGWKASASAYVATDGAGAHDRLTYDGTWRWRDGDSQTVETYGGPGGQISSVTDTSGNTVRYEYTGNRLRDIFTANGENLHYDWNSSGNLIQIRTFYTANGTAKALTRTRYGYDSQNRLETVTVDLSPEDESVADGKSYTTTYIYVPGTRLVASIQETDGSRLDIRHDGAGRVVSLSQILAGGVIRTTAIAYGANTTTITDPQNNETRLDYAAGTNRLATITTPGPSVGAARQVVAFAYDADGNLERVTDPAGAITRYEYDANGNATLVTQQALGQSTWRSYSATNQLTVEMREGTDANGTSYHSTRYAYDAADRLRFAVDADGGVTEYVVGQYGRVDAVRQYAEDAFDTNGWQWQRPLDYAGMVAWAAGRTGTPLVQTAYDERLNVQQRINYGRTEGAAIPSTVDGYTHRYFTYDQAGQLLSRVTAGMNPESFVYDGLGRLVASTDSAGAATSILFDDAATRTVVTLASGLVRTSTTNKAGELVSVTESGAYTATGATSHTYDALGRVRVTTVATDADPAHAVRTYHVYDAVGRTVADVDAGGAMTEYRYDANDRLVATVRYATLLSAAQLALAANPNASPEISGLRPGGAPDDLWAWTVYDAGGRVIETIAGDGSVTAFDYDKSDRLVRATVFDTRLSAAQLGGFRSAAPAATVLPAGSVRDSVARTFYDRAGRVVGTLDGEGRLTRTRYDAIGRPVEETAYATPAATTLRATGTFARLVESVGANPADAVTRSVYDGQGFLRFTIDGLNRVTAYGYQTDVAFSAFGPVRQVTRYAGTIAALTRHTMDTVRQALANAGLLGHNDNRVDQSVYDGAGRLVYAIDAAGAVTGYRYDSSGRVVRTVAYGDLRPAAALPTEAEMNAWNAVAMANPANRITRHYYNARGELRFTIDAEGYVTRTDHDGRGRVTYTGTYSNRVGATDGWTIDTVAANLSGDAAGSSILYDANGRVWRTTDPTGHVLETLYDATGTLLWEIASPGHGGGEPHALQP